MKNHIMLDFETLGTNNDTCVLSLGAVHFNRDGFGPMKYWVFNLHEQLRARRAVQADTLAWWIDKPKEAQAVFKQSATAGVSMHTFTPEFMEFFKQREKPLVWGYTLLQNSKGAAFDRTRK